MRVNQNVIICDVETGGFSPLKNPLTQISLIAIDSFTFEEKCRYDSYIKPYDDSLYITSDASALTGIDEKLLIEKGKDLKEVLDELCQIFKSLKVSYYLPYFCGHNFNFDIMYIKDVFNRIYGENSGKNGQNKLFDYVLDTSEDTMLLARKKFINDEVPNFKLETISEYLNIHNRNAHNSLADVETTLSIYKYFITSLRGGNADSIIEEENSKEKFNYQF